MTGSPVRDVLFDPYDPATQDDPFPVYDALRRDHPCYRDPAGRFFAISRYEDVREALNRHETYSNAGGIILGSDVSAAPPSMVLMDPPQHTRLRNLVSRAFTPRRIATFEAALLESVDEFIDAFDLTGEVDLVPVFADLVPVRGSPTSSAFLARAGAVPRVGRQDDR